MICPYCQSKNRRDDPFNGFSAKYSCVDKDHKFFYREEFNFILTLTEYPNHIISQNETGCVFEIWKCIFLNSHSHFNQTIFYLNLEPMHYSKSYDTFKRVVNMLAFA
jgi:hypothetical protein